MGATGCANSFGNPVPCLQEGEARKKRKADDEAEAEAAPAATVLPLGYAGLGYNGLGYAGLAGLPYSTALPAALPAPTVTEVEVPQYKLVPQEKVVEVAPACQNAWGFPVPCLRKRRDADVEAEAAPASYPSSWIRWSGLCWSRIPRSPIRWTWMLVWDIMVCLTPDWDTMVLDTLGLDTLVLDTTVWDTVFLLLKSLPLMLPRMLS